MMCDQGNRELTSVEETIFGVTKLFRFLFAIPNASLFSLDTKAGWTPLPCQKKKKHCKNILVRTPETRGGEACDTCTSGLAKSGKAGRHICIQISVGKQSVNPAASVLRQLH